MSKIATLIDPQVAQKMQAVAAEVSTKEPAKQTKQANKADKGFIVTRKATDPVPPKRHAERCKCPSCTEGRTVAMTVADYTARYYPPRPLTSADAIEIDPESEAMIEARCVDCTRPLLIDPKVPEGVDPTVPRVPICENCGHIRVSMEKQRREAMNDQRAIEVAKRTRQPAPIQAIQPIEKENDMDMNTLSDAELGATIREQMQAEKAKQVKAAKPKVDKKRKAKKEKVKADVKAEQQARKTRVLAGFTLGNVEVPTLDLTNVSSLDEAPSAKERSPYNKCLFRAKETILDPEVTTYRTLMDLHERFAGEAGEAKPKKKGKKKQAVAVVADLNPTEDAKKVTALAKTLGISEKKACKLIAAL